MAKRRNELPPLEANSRKTPATSVARDVAVKSGLTAKTDFGKKLLAIRNKAIKNGLPLLSNDEILAEVASGRNELP